MMRPFLSNIIKRHWLIDSRLHPTQTETSAMPLRKHTIPYEGNRTVCAVRHINVQPQT